MSEFSHHRNIRIEKLRELFNSIVKNGEVKELFQQYREIIDICVPSDVVYLVHDLVQAEIPMPELKKAINKLLNLLHKTILA